MKPIKLLCKGLLLLFILIISFYGTTFIQTWWDGDLEAKYCPVEISNAMDKKLRAAIKYHGSGYVYRSDWERWEFTFERDGQTINTFAYLGETE